MKTQNGLIMAFLAGFQATFSAPTHGMNAKEASLIPDPSMAQQQARMPLPPVKFPVDYHPFLDYDTEPGEFKDLQGIGGADGYGDNNSYSSPSIKSDIFDVKDEEYRKEDATKGSVDDTSNAETGVDPTVIGEQALNTDQQLDDSPESHAQMEAFLRELLDGQKSSDFQTPEAGMPQSLNPNDVSGSMDHLDLKTGDMDDSYDYLFHGQQSPDITSDNQYGQADITPVDYGKFIGSNKRSRMNDDDDYYPSLASRKRTAIA